MTGLGSPCGACKFLRRKCVKGCVFAPYFCHEQGAAHFAAIHKVFGASNASKILMHLPVSDRCEAAVTMSYEAQARLRDPIYGCVAHIFSLQQQVVSLQAQLESLKAQATQGYGDGCSISSPRNDSCGKMFTSILQDGQQFVGPTMASNSSVKNENHSYFANDHFAPMSAQSSQGFEAELCMADYSNTNPCCSVQGNGYHDMEDLQSVAFAYLNQA
uniref:LOB domain-containing protein n=1 Tax=Oryza punctata TaxID=4537 RepID=A0A0E0LY13_ORYPU